MQTHKGYSKGIMSMSLAHEDKQYLIRGWIRGWFGNVAGAAGKVITECNCKRNHSQMERETVLIKHHQGVQYIEIRLRVVTEMVSSNNQLLLLITLESKIFLFVLLNQM